MPMPPQLAKAKRPRKSLRPILEQLPAVSTTELRISSLYRGKYAILKPLKIPNIVSVKVSLTHVEFHFKSLHRGAEGPVQRFNIKPIRCGFGNFRHCFHCNTCGKPVKKLYYLNRSLLCRHCTKARYLSQAITPNSRPLLQAARLQAFLDSRPKLKHARQRLEQRFGLKLMQAQSRFSTRTTLQD
jgi:hypothetical protein